MKKNLIIIIIFLLVICLQNICFGYEITDENFDVYNDTSLSNDSSSESVEIDLTETNNILSVNFGHIKAYLFLICLYLLCKTVYGCIWFLYKKTLL